MCNENTFYILACTYKRAHRYKLKTQSRIFKMLFMVVILLVPEPKENLPLM